MKIKVLSDDNKTFKEVDVTNNEFKSSLKIYLKDCPFVSGCFIYSSQSNYDYIIRRRLKASRDKLKRRK